MPALALLAALASGAAYWHSVEQGSSRKTPLTNYGVIWPHELTRSGLPGSGQGWTWLRQQGVRSIVTFRTENDVDYEKFGFEHVMRIPLSGSIMPTKEQATAYLKFIQDPANQPVHIHCTAGKSRTGMMAALVRYSIDGWPLQRALDEARQYRDGKDLSSERVAWLRAWANQYPPGSFKMTP
jgi:protein tyrosine/serine phosphatase